MADTKSGLHSRRSLILGSAGAVAALVAQSIGRPVAAANGDTIKVGGSHEGTSTTRVFNDTDSSTVLWGQSFSGGNGVRGSSDTSSGGMFTSTSGAGLSSSSNSGSGGHFNSSSGTGLTSNSLLSTGVLGFSGAGAGPTPLAHVGVYGRADSSHSTAVFGKSTDGWGMRAESTNGYGLVAASHARAGVYGISFVTESRNDGAVTGVSSGATGVYGYSGVSSLPNGPVRTAVFGYSDVVDSVGVHGKSTDGTGVIGEGTEFGVLGTTGNGIGVDGRAADDTSAGIGVRGRSQGDTGIGVLGITDDGDVDAVAVKGIGATGVLGSTTSGRAIHGIASTVNGFAGVFEGKVSISRFVDVAEIAGPAAPAADTARLFVRDNGAGKTQLCVRFNTGAVVVLATQA